MVGSFLSSVFSSNFIPILNWALLYWFLLIGTLIRVAGRMASIDYIGVLSPPFGIASFVSAFLPLYYDQRHEGKALESKYYPG